MSEQALLTGLLRDEAAIRLVQSVFEACQIADDLVDGDKEIDKSRVMCRLLSLCLIEIPANPFYKRFAGFLMPGLMQAIAQWGASNELRQHEDADVQRWAWAMRDVVEHIITSCAYLEGGMEAALNAAIEVGIHFRTDGDRESAEEWGNSL